MAQASSACDAISRGVARSGTPGAARVGDERRTVAANLRRLLARLDMTLLDAVGATRLDERTLRSLLRGSARPHARTLHKLAAGLDVEVEELFRDACYDGSLAAAFDRAANPVAAEFVADHPQLFAGWTVAEFDELFSRVAVGGQLKAEGTQAAVELMNRRRQILRQVSVLCETEQASLLEEFVAWLYRRATDVTGSSADDNGRNCE